MIFIVKMCPRLLEHPVLHFLFTCNFCFEFYGLKACVFVSAENTKS